MNLSRLRETLIVHEGLELKPYTCSAGYLTIGVGRNLQANGISNDEAMLLLENDLARVVRECERAFPWMERLDDVRQEVIINMCFNLGIVKLSQFVKTLDAVKRGDYTEAARRMLESRWARQVKGRAVFLAELMAKGSIEG